MPNIDRFESAFRAAAKAVFHHRPVVLRKVLVVTDLAVDAADGYAARVKRFLAGLPRADAIAWSVAKGDEVETVGALLERVQQEQPDLVCTYRNLHSGAFRWPYTLGDHVEVLTQVTTVPVLLLPRPDAGAALDEGLANTAQVMAVTDHLTGDDALVSWAVALTAPKGTLLLAHVEDEAVFERYMAVIGKVPDVDTAVARAQIRAQLLKEPRDFIETCRAGLAQAGLDLTVVAEVAMGHHLSVYRDLIAEHGVDLLVMNTKDEDQLAMHGLAYPLAVELRGVPLLML